MLEVGILKNFDSGTYKAGVQLAGSLTTYFDDISVAKNIPSSTLVIGNYVILAIPGGNPKDACVIATWPQGSPGGGAASFLDLSDTPSSYSGQARKLLAIKNDESALEFISGKAFYAIAPPEEVYEMSDVSNTPRTATIDSVSGDVITLTANDAYQFFHNNMEGNSYLKIANTSKSPSEYAWVKATPAANQLKVTDSADISGWSNGDTISTAQDGATSNQVEVDLSPLIGSEAIGILVAFSARDSGTITSSPAIRSSISPDGSSESFVHVNCQVTDILNDVTPFVPVDSNQHVVLRDKASGVDTISVWVKVAGYVK